MTGIRNLDASAANAENSASGADGSLPPEHWPRDTCGRGFPASSELDEELAMQRQRMGLKVWALRQTPPYPQRPSHPVMVSRFARDTGLLPGAVMMTLADKYNVVEARHYARPSMRGRLARMTLEAHDRQIAARVPPTARSGNTLAKLAPLDP